MTRKAIDTSILSIFIGTVIRATIIVTRQIAQFVGTATLISIFVSLSVGAATLDLQIPERSTTSADSITDNLDADTELSLFTNAFKAS